jgi:hypothetical protein
MLRITKFRLALALTLALSPLLIMVRADAQDDPNEMPLGDVARNLRKKSPPARDVIDDDNLSKVMDEAEKRHAPGAALRFLMVGESKGFQVATPEATCSLSFSANAKSLLSNQYAQMELPPGEMLKLSGPATIEGDALTVSIFNGTAWHVSELAVALTVVKKDAPPAASLAYGPTEIDVLPGSEVRPEKRPDTTVIYRMRAAASPSAMTVFSAPLNLDLVPGDEWHWSIVQARGYPPEGYSPGTPHEVAQTGQPLSVAPTLAPLASPEAVSPNRADPGSQ